jgi:hypothetical protein
MHKVVKKLVLFFVFLFLEVEGLAKNFVKNWRMRGREWRYLWRLEAGNRDICGGWRPGIEIFVEVGGRE